MRLAPRGFNFIREGVTHDDPVSAGHRLKRPDPALIPERELLDFTDKPLVLRHLFNGNPK